MAWGGGQTGQPAEVGVRRLVDGPVCLTQVKEEGRGLVQYWKIWQMVPQVFVSDLWRYIRNEGCYYTVKTYETYKGKDQDSKSAGSHTPVVMNPSVSYSDT